MSHFYESFQKELGKRIAQIVSATLVAVLSTAALSMPKDMYKTQLILLGLAGLSLLVLASGLLFRYLSYRNSKHEIETVKINSLTCTWIQDPPVWKHKTDGLYYCPRCAPNPSPLSSDWFCPKCSMGFGKGECFVIPNDYN